MKSITSFLMEQPKASYAGDMIANLTTLPAPPPLPEGIALKRALPADKSRILAFVRLHFNKNWVNEAEYALNREPPACFLATENGSLVGFACYDASAKGFFGPTGVAKTQRGRGVGAALLFRTLEAMREYGYGYAVIGWVGETADFYRKTVGAQYIPGGEPKNSVYSRFIFMD